MLPHYTHLGCRPRVSEVKVCSLVAARPALLATLTLSKSATTRDRREELVPRAESASRGGEHSRVVEKAIKLHQT
ncbi:hypothetical protein J6590_004771 [Homalodisca vitripennis]|nr:hypothetical protein J6590_004771 [Homalodisca vitripennis]